MYSGKRFFFSVVVGVGLLLAPTPLLLAQDTAGEAYDAYVEDGTYESEDEYEEEYYGPFSSGFGISDSIRNIEHQQQQITDSDWKQISQKPEYVYEKKVVKPKIEKDSGESWLGKLMLQIILFLSSTAGIALMWLLLAAIVLAIVWYAFKNNGIYVFARGSRKVKKDQQDELADDFVPESWDEVIANAEAQLDYRLALRHAYRHILHLMEERQIILRNNAQSNYQYLSALRNTPFFDDFKILLKHYEYVWYGHYDLGASSYTSVKAIYQNLKAKL